MISEVTMRLGIGLCCNKMQLIAFDTAGRECLRRRVPTPRNDYRATLADVRGLVVRSERELGVDGSVDIDARWRT